MRQQFKAILKGEFSFYPTDSELTPSKVSKVLDFFSYLLENST